MKRWHLTTKEKAQIKKLTLARVPQSTIGRILGVGRDTVSKWQVRMGLPTVPPVPEDKILKLFLKGMSGQKIHEKLRVPANRVWAVYKKYGLQPLLHPDGTGARTPKGNIPAFTAAIKNRENYINHLAKKYGVGICKAKQLAREVLATPRFRPGASKPVLSSDFPQRHFDVKLAGPDESLKLVTKICDACFEGTLPPISDAAFVAIMMAAFAPLTLQGQPEPVLDSFRAGLFEAVHVLRCSVGTVN
jgi:hypothetical protein